MKNKTKRDRHPYRTTRQSLSISRIWGCADPRGTRGQRWSEWALREQTGGDYYWICFGSNCGKELFFHLDFIAEPNFYGAVRICVVSLWSLHSFWMEQMFFIGSNHSANNPATCSLWFKTKPTLQAAGVELYKEPGLWLCQQDGHTVHDLDTTLRSAIGIWKIIEEARHQNAV